MAGKKRPSRDEILVKYLEEKIKISTNMREQLEFAKGFTADREARNTIKKLIEFVYYVENTDCQIQGELYEEDTNE